MEHIRSFGRLNIDNYKFHADPTFAIEDYICPDVDHELMYKCLKGLDEVTPQDLEENGNNENSQSVNQEGIVHMTAEQKQNDLALEAAQLRMFERFMAEDAFKPELSPDEIMAKKLIAMRDSGELFADQNGYRKPRKNKRKIKINQYKGTINLKNISNLTISTTCSRDTTLTIQKDIQNNDNTLSVDDQPTSFGCEFYNRLVNDIKQTLDSTTNSPTTSSSPHTNKTSPTTPSSQSFSSDSSPSITSSPPLDCNRKLFQNIRNHINVHAGTSNARPSHLSETEQIPSSGHDAVDNGKESDEQPVQIEQWLKQIITQTEVEPVPPIVEILEHSLITETIQSTPHNAIEESH